MPGTSTKKRKRDSPSVAEDADPARDAMEIFKRHFEAQFAPLKETRKKKAKKEPKVETEDEWEGFSDGDVGAEGERRLPDYLDPANVYSVVAPAPEVVEFDASKDPLAGETKLPKSILKSFMSSKPPSILPPSELETKKKKKKGKKAAPDDSTADEDPTTEATLLKNDLALQRLLRESHLLDASSATLEATGKNRLKAIESRVQALGGKDITGQKHPMAVRKGMDAAKRLKEEKRRKHAKEAGIVLEKEVRVKKMSEREKTRDRGFGPSVGRFRNGTLVLSKRDVMDIEGRTGSGGGKGGKGGKGKGFKGSKGGKGGKKRR